jgi:hypothetical protein
MVSGRRKVDGGGRDDPSLWHGSSMARTPAVGMPNEDACVGETGRLRLEKWTYVPSYVVCTSSRCNLPPDELENRAEYIV